ncbi:MAG: hypothetical protein Q7K42_06635 [Candidatus Diapherotrites archaeon]|nr:hypothetical protein [Candidatus Diapherotrites archaeon]
MPEPRRPSERIPTPRKSATSRRLGRAYATKRPEKTSVFTEINTRLKALKLHIYIDEIAHEGNLNYLSEPDRKKLVQMVGKIENIFGIKFPDFRGQHEEVPDIFVVRFFKLILERFEKQEISSAEYRNLKSFLNEFPHLGPKPAPKRRPRK